LGNKVGGKTVDRIKVAAIQFDSKSGDKERNLLNAIKLIEQSAEHHVRIAAIPDWFYTGYPITRENVTKWAEPVPGPATNALAETARKHGMYIVGGSIIETDGGSLYCTCPILDPNGELLGKYRKVNFWMLPPVDEAGSGLMPGTDYPVFEIDGTRIGVMLQIDIDFPETARVLALRGAEILFWLTAVQYPWMDVCRALARAYAFVNCAYFIIANRTGVFDRYTYYGESAILNPFGDTIASAGQSYGALFPEGIALASLDLETLHRTREMLKPFERRKPETYTEIVSRVQRSHS